MENGRAFTRVHVPIQVGIIQNDIERSGTIADISMNGASIQCDDWSSLTQEQECELNILLGSAENPLSIVAHGKVVRSTDDRLAVAFDTVDLESYPYLRDLIRYNAERTEQVEEEFTSHMGIR